MFLINNNALNWQYCTKTNILRCDNKKPGGKKIQEKSLFIYKFMKLSPIERFFCYYHCYY